MAYDQDAVDKAVEILQPQIDNIKATVSALNTKISSLVLQNISPNTVTQTYDDGSIVTYHKV